MTSRPHQDLPPVESGATERKPLDRREIYRRIVAQALFLDTAGIPTGVCSNDRILPTDHNERLESDHSDPGGYTIHVDGKTGEMTVTQNDQGEIL